MMAQCLASFLYPTTSLWTRMMIKGFCFFFQKEALSGLFRQAKFDAVARHGMGLRAADGSAGSKPRPQAMLLRGIFLHFSNKDKPPCQFHGPRYGTFGEMFFECQQNDFRVNFHTMHKDKA
jgi:hypothetical protein